MTTLASTESGTVLRRAAVRATLAPSIHNTQPWRLQVRGGALELFADRDRRLSVLDATGRQLLISCGCALMNARVSLAASGVGVDVSRAANPALADLLASLTPSGRPVDEALAALDPVIEVRRTNRRQFAADEVPDTVLSELQRVAEIEGASLFVVRREEHRLALTMLSQHADDVELTNPAYRAELRAWTTDDAYRRDGVPSTAVPHVDGTAEDDVPIRDFDTHGTGALPAATHSSRNQTLSLLCTAQDSPEAWLRAGEALERVWLELTRQGFAASPLTQVTEVPSARAQLRRELQMSDFPQLLLRIGRAPATPSTRRRRLVDVLVADG